MFLFPLLNDFVLDPFCGCGTTIAAAQKLNIQWIGIDITQLSIALQKYRLKDTIGLDPIGERTLLSARKTAEADADNVNSEAQADKSI